MIKVEKVFGCKFKGKYLDCGTIDGYIKSFKYYNSYMKITIIGTGYVGLVSGVLFADLGNDVICVDNDNKKINLLKKGIVPIYEPGLEEILKKNIKSKRIKFTSNISEAIKLSKIILSL